MQNVHALAELGNRHVARLEPAQCLRHQRQRLERQMHRMRLGHRLGVIERDEHLVLALARPRAPEPDLVLGVVARDVRDDFLHVEPLAGAVVALQARRECGLEDQPQLFAERVSEVVREGLVKTPDALRVVVWHSACLPLSQLELNGVVFFVHVDVSGRRRGTSGRGTLLRVERGIVDDGAFNILPSLDRSTLLVKRLNFRWLVALLSLHRCINVHGRQLVALLLRVKQGEFVELGNLLLSSGPERLHVVIGVVRTQILRARGLLVGGNGLLARTVALIRVQDLVEALSDLFQRVAEAAQRVARQLSVGLRPGLSLLRAIGGRSSNLGLRHLCRRLGSRIGGLGGTVVNQQGKTEWKSMHAPIVVLRLLLCCSGVLSSYSGRATSLTRGCTLPAVLLFLVTRIHIAFSCSDVWLSNGVVVGRFVGLGSLLVVVHLGRLSGRFRFLPLHWLRCIFDRRFVAVGLVFRRFRVRPCIFIICVHCVVLWPIVHFHLVRHLFAETQIHVVGQIQGVRILNVIVHRRAARIWMVLVFFFTLCHDRVLCVGRWLLIVRLLAAVLLLLALGLLLSFLRNDF
ncbi:hypothetical protein C8R45DRAFT_442105 [Mycena sanguinolenta]|nr:hypothetical protein C8R45DRAFT_442105 [Mycena sanguinolenta]